MVAAAAAAFVALCWAGSAAAKDLTVTFAAPTDGVHNASFAVDVTVFNDASGASGAPVEVQLYLDGSPVGPLLDFGQMSSNTNASDSASVLGACGVHNLTATVDPNDSVAESDELNNNFSAQVAIQPSVNFTYAITGDLGSHTLTLTADTEGCAPLDYLWDVDEVTKPGSPASYSPLAGDLNVTLTASSPTVPAINRSITRVVTIPNKAPSVLATLGDPQITTGEPLAVQVQASDEDGVVASFLVEFGDGNSTASLAEAFDHTYPVPGNYTVTVTATDNLMATAVATVNVTVANRLPVAHTPTYLAGNQGEEITFDGSSSSDPDGGTVTITWDFGDGEAGTGPIVRHAYGEARTYTAKMTVTDPHGGATTANITVNVQASGDPGAGLLVVAGLFIFVVALAAGYFMLAKKRKGERPADASPGVPKVPPPPPPEQP
jgi:hypothetical protein